MAAAMWNHQPHMASAPPELTVKEMREITSYLWAGKFFEDGGGGAAGRRVFTAKRCATCHEDAASGAPKLTGKTFNGSIMVAAAKGIPWPRFDGAQMSDLIAFLNSASRRKPRLNFEMRKTVRKYYDSLRDSTKMESRLRSAAHLRWCSGDAAEFAQY
jgi:mono/diheme cytochrome c family protein